MATWIPNQPVFFGDLTNDCSCDSESGAQLVDNSDSTQVQFSLSPCPDAESLIVDTNFNDSDQWNLGSNWTIFYNQLCLTEGNLINTYVFGQDVLQDGKYYQVNITVDNISDGSIAIYIGGTLIGEVSVSGEYSFYGIATNSGFSPGYALTFVNIDPEVSCCISEASVYEIFTQFKFAIYNNSGSYVTEISYANNPDYFSFVQDSLTVTVPWGEIELSDGCFYICLLDPCTNSNGQNIPIDITNPNFTGNANGWTLGANWTYGANAVSYTPGAGTLSQTIFPTYSFFTRVTIVVTAITGDLNVYFGASLMGTIQGVGTHEYNGNPYGGFGIVLEPSVGGAGTVTSVTWEAPTTSEYICDMQSNTFKLGEYADQCTMLVNGCNNENGLGFVFSGSGFTPRLRIESKLKQAKYQNERTVYEDSLGSKKNVYYRRRKAKYFCVDLQPEYIHDFLSLAIGFDNLYINGVSYFVEDDEYSVDYSEANDNLGSVKILVSEKVQNVVNINCTDEENVCTLPPNYLLRADDAGSYIVQTNGARFLING